MVRMWCKCGQQVAVGSDYLVGGVTVYADVSFEGTLLFVGKVVVDAVLAREMVLGNGCIPRFFIAVVGEIKIYDVEIFELFLHRQPFPGSKETWATVMVAIESIDIKSRNSLMSF